METNQIIILFLLFIGFYLILAPHQFNQYLPVTLDISTRQILGSIALLTAYYYYNNEKLF